MKCLECKAPVEQTPGKREKQFCNSTCRSNYWQKAKRKVKENSKPENKERILKERQAQNSAASKAKNPLTKDQAFKPKSLEELKALCPPELKGFDRSTWISAERQKYGI